ncbi:hypothetical protein [Paenibacillus flagellatus]|uniref:Cytosolic protein n=1 Tax=Paenibacillus flagellatus TaxID=2211139 RepID=A0A2V5KGH4_9BACL|nr:hypothetical protein [Paenibacillus flagellatus]PYI57453.1 hypothetical protein DLM86_03175 [Paenibacillus flagellatus]
MSENEYANANENKTPRNGGEGFLEERRSDYTDLATVESQRNDLTAEEFPEGPYGSSLLTESLGKSTPWREDQRPPNSFNYENRELHEGLNRGGYPADHNTHDESHDEYPTDSD